MSTDNDSSGRPVAVAHAEIGGDAWRNVVHTLRADHSDWYAVTGEIVDTLRCLASVSSLLARQIAGYSTGQVLRDDAGADPAERLAEARSYANELRAHLDAADLVANRFWSEIGHIAVEDR